MRYFWLVLLVIILSTISAVPNANTLRVPVQIDSQTVIIQVIMPADTTVSAPAPTTGLSIKDVEKIIEMSGEYGRSRMEWLDKFLTALGVLLAGVSVIVVVFIATGWVNRKEMKEEVGEIKKDALDLKRKLEEDVERVKKEFGSSKRQYDMMKARTEDKIQEFRQKVEGIALNLDKIDDEMTVLNEKQKYEMEEYIRVTELLCLFGDELKDEEYYYRWKAFMLLQKYYYAIEEVDCRLKTDSTQQDWLERGAIAAFGAGEYSQSLQYSARLIEQYPQSVISWYNKGVVLDKLGRSEEALAAFNEALRIDPKFTDSWFNKACALSFLKRKDEMLESLKKAIELDGNHRKQAREDEDFKAYWDDPDFIALTKDDDEEKKE